MEQVIAHIDFETRSAVELQKTGVHVYANHPSTDLWCMAWVLGDGEPEVWVPGDPFPAALRKHVMEGGALYAHNAQFERVMWNSVGVRKYGFPGTRPDQWYCTAAMAAAMSLPRSLGECAAVLGLLEQKDVEGSRLMLQMCRPRRKEKDGYVWWDQPEKIARLAKYCAQDVRTEMALTRKLRPLSDEERKVYLLDQSINDRGVPLDRDLAEACREVIDEALERVNSDISAMTDDYVQKVTQTGALKRWLSAQGVETSSISKAAVEDLLSRGDLPTAVEKVLEARQEGGRSSVAKIDSMLHYAGGDDRMRGLLLYHGASTGRWSGKGPQPQNLPKPERGLSEEDLDVLRSRNMAWIEEIDSPFVMATSALRPLICAPHGMELAAADFAAIEARVVAWCAGQEDMLDLFREGGDPYVDMASTVYDLPPDKVEKFPHRQLGKAAVLGCGFGMGGPRFMEQAASYGVIIDEDFAKQVVNLYRQKNNKIVKWWDKLDRAVMNAVKHPGRVYEAGPVKFAVSGSYLWCLLPSGRRLCYPSPRVEVQVNDRGYERQVVTTWGINSRTRKWGPQTMWRGVWAENVVQAIARDVMVDAMFRLERNGLKVILTVHDEIVCEAPEGSVDPERMESLLSQTPSWAPGLPVKAEAWVGKRYRK